jgi:hypothetical protein
MGRKAAIAETILNVMLPILMSGQEKEKEKEKNQPEEEEEEKICISEPGKCRSFGEGDTAKFPVTNMEEIEPKLFGFDIIN